MAEFINVIIFCMAVFQNVQFFQRRYYVGPDGEAYAKIQGTTISYFLLAPKS